MSNLIGTQAFGLRIPLIKEGDDIIEAIIDSYVATGVRNGDVDGERAESGRRLMG